MKAVLTITHVSINCMFVLTVSSSVIPFTRVVLVSTFRAHSNCCYSSKSALWICNCTPSGCALVHYFVKQCIGKTQYWNAQFNIRRNCLMMLLF